MVNESAPRWQQIYAIPGMLIFGTATIVTQKFLFVQEAEGRYGVVHEFRKPWFQTDSMFLGMTLSLVAYLILGKRDKVNGPSEVEENTGPRWKLYFGAMVPSICDLVATSLMNVQLLYIQASVWQMLRGSMVIFSSIFCAFILKRPHFPYMWWSVIGVVCALTIVGVAAVCDTGAGVDGVSQSETVMAIFLTVLAQVVQASQLVIEDWILHDYKVHPLQLVGLKGFWGFFWCTSVVVPAVTYLDGIEGNGIHEDFIDSFIMIGNSPVLLAFVILYVFFILGYNIGGMLVINVYSAVHRTILEGLRTLCIWVVQVIIYYSTKATGAKVIKVGEKLTRWSFLQLSGFLLLFTCNLMYNKIIRLDCFKYPDDINPNESMEVSLVQESEPPEPK